MLGATGEIRRQGQEPRLDAGAEGPPATTLHKVSIDPNFPLPRTGDGKKEAEGTLGGMAVIGQGDDTAQPHHTVHRGFESPPSHRQIDGIPVFVFEGGAGKIRIAPHLEAPVRGNLHLAGLLSFQTGRRRQDEQQQPQEHRSKVPDPLVPALCLHHVLQRPIHAGG